LKAAYLVGSACYLAAAALYLLRLAPAAEAADGAG